MSSCLLLLPLSFCLLFFTFFPAAVGTGNVDRTSGSGGSTDGGGGVSASQIQNNNIPYLRVCCAEGKPILNETGCVDFTAPDPLGSIKSGGGSGSSGSRISDRDLATLSQAIRTAAEWACKPFVSYASIPILGRPQAGAAAAATAQPPEHLAEFCAEKLGSNAIPRAHPRRVFDAFPFNHEVTLLELRLAELGSEVYAHVLVESTIAHSGKPKELHYYPIREQFASFATPIRHLVVPLTSDVLASEGRRACTPGESWRREELQRDLGYLGLFDASPDDVVILSDTDEIPASAVVRALRWCDVVSSSVGGRHSGAVVEDMFTIPLVMYYYHLGCRFWSYLTRVPYWVRAKVVRFGFLQAIRRTCWLRDSPIKYRTPFPSGWHLSYFGGVEAIQTKLQRYSHVEFDHPAHRKADHIEDSMARCVDLLNRGGANSLARGSSKAKTRKKAGKGGGSGVIVRTDHAVDLAFLPLAILANPERYPSVFPLHREAMWTQQIQYCHHPSKGTSPPTMSVQALPSQDIYLRCCEGHVLQLIRLAWPDVAESGACGNTTAGLQALAEMCQHQHKCVLPTTAVSAVTRAAFPPQACGHPETSTRIEFSCVLGK